MKRICDTYIAVVVLLLFLFPNFNNAQSKRALLIGISKYENDCSEELAWSEIHGCNDIDIIKQALRNQSFQVKCLTGKHATAQNIRKAFVRLIDETQFGDVIYIHLSGHGQAYEDENGDESDGWDESFISYNAKKRYDAKSYRGQNHVIDDELHEYLVSLRRKAGLKGAVYVVIDACHAGSSYRSEDENTYIRGAAEGFSKSGKKYAPSVDKSSNIKLSRGKDLSAIFVLEACRSYEVNSEILENGKYYGPLSYYMSLILQKEDISVSSQWINEVKKLMDSDMRLVRQHLVIESSK